VFFEADGSLIADFPDYFPFNDESEPYVTIQQYRPFDTGFNGLSGLEGLGSRKDQTFAADIQHLTDIRSEPGQRFCPPAFDRQPQRKTMAAPAFSDLCHQKLFTRLEPLHCV
jgi:hypothetical protein